MCSSYLIHGNFLGLWRCKLMKLNKSTKEFGASLKSVGTAKIKMLEANYENLMLWICRLELIKRRTCIKMFFDFHGTLKFALLCLVDEILVLAAKKIEWVFPFGTIFHYRFLGTFSAKKWWHSSDISIFWVHDLTKPFLFFKILLYSYWSSCIMPLWLLVTIRACGLRSEGPSILLSTVTAHSWTLHFLLFKDGGLGKCVANEKGRKNLLRW